jgi:lipoprotein-releasing system permease protein
MTFSTFLAFRFLRTKHKPGILRLITALAVFGVAAGVTSLVLALGMNSGFRKVIQEGLLGATAHMSLLRPASDGIRDYDALAERLGRVPHVQAVSPALYETVLVASGVRAKGVVLKGVDPEREKQTGGILRSVPASVLASLAPDENQAEGLLLGKLLADHLQVAAGDWVTITSPQGHLTPFGIVPRTKRYRVAGIFDSGFYDYDSAWVLGDLRTVQALLGLGDIVSTIEFRLDDLELADRVGAEVLRAAGPGFATTNWMEQNKALFRALRLEKLVTAIFIGLIVLVAGLNILVLLVMTVNHKARDIAILVAMGAKTGQVSRVFLVQGLAIGLLGTLVGLAAGNALSFLCDHYHLIPLDPEIYAISYLPFRSELADGIWITLAAAAISLAATIYPARSAAAILPVEILRYQ